MKLVIASNNAHKVREIKQILATKFDDVLSMKEMGINVDVEENGTTFEENALIKARAIHALLQDVAVLADDSGLIVDFLNGAPGVYSSRFSGNGDAANNQKLLDLMKDVPDEKRSCRFASCVALVRTGYADVTAMGYCEGLVGRALKGSGGFGYDPLFYVSELDKTYAELTEEEKNAISHRARALANLYTLLVSED